jgi:threonyl-tRNA synthetase
MLPNGGLMHNSATIRCQLNSTNSHAKALDARKAAKSVGLKRLRAFTYAWTATPSAFDLEQAKKEFMIRFDLCISVLDDIGLVKDDYEIAMRFTKDFYAENKDFIASIVAKFGKPVLAEVWNERFFYFALKWDLNFVDNQDKAAALSTDQIDVENAKLLRYTVR